MAVAFGGFSIREYAAGIRKVDARKCWPFGGDVRESLLPPIESRRYRLWSSELKIFRSSENIERERDAADRRESDPVDAGGEIRNQELSESGRDLVASQIPSIAERNGKAETSIQEKNKARSPKKRSITELIAVPSPVNASVEHKVDNAGVAAAEISAEVRITGKEVTKDRGKKRPKMTKQRENRKRKNQLSDSLSIEEKISKSNIHPQADVADLPCKMANKDNDFQATEIEETVQEEISNSLTDASLDFNTSETSESDRKSSDEIYLQGHNNTSSRSYLGEKQTLPTLGSPHMKSLYKVFSDVLSAASAAHKSLQATDQPVTEKIIGEKNHVSLISMKSANVPDVIDADDPGGSIEKRIGSVHMVDLNNPAESSGCPFEPDSREKEETIVSHVDANSRAITVVTGENQPLIPLAVPLFPSVVGSNAALVSPPSAVIIKRKRTPGDSPMVAANPRLPIESVSSVSFQRWLPSEIPERDVITSLPLNSQGELTYMPSSTEGSQKLQKIEAWSPFQRNRLQAHNFVDSFSPVVHNQQANKTQFRWEPGRKVSNASEIPFEGPLNKRNEASLPAHTQLPTLRLMGKDVTVGRSTNEHQGVSEAESCGNQRTISFIGPNTRLPGAGRISYMPAHHLACQILDKPTTSSASSLNFKKQTDNPVLSPEGMGTIPGNHYHPAHRNHPRVAKTWLGHEVLEIGVEVPLNIDHSFAVNSAYQMHRERHSTPLSHLGTPSIHPPSQDLTLYLGNEDFAQPPATHFPGFPVSSSSLQTPYTFSFDPAHRLSSLPTFNLTNRIDENSFSFVSNVMMKPNKIGEQSLIYGQNNSYMNLDVIDSANDGSPRSKPVKLRAGAKHILKPGSKMTDPTKPLLANRSVSPFSGENSSSKAPVNF